MLSELLAVTQELLHAVVVIDLEEVFEAVSQAKLLVGIGQNTDVNDGKHVAAHFLQVLRGASHHDDKFLLSFGTKFECDALRELFRNRVLNVPSLMLNLTVDYSFRGLFS